MEPFSSTLARPDQPVIVEDPSRTDWIRAGVIAGFVATFSMTVCLTLAYAVANTLGSADGTTLERWFFALSQNELTRGIQSTFFLGMILNLLMGLVWAIVYARFAEPRMSGPGWRKGLLFSILPFMLTVIVFFPISGIGFFGSEAQAGPLAAVGALILHLVYGLLLGSLYAIDADSGLGDAAGESEAAASAERGAAIGIGIGAVIGFVGGWLLAPGMADLASRPVLGIAGALSGAAIGILMGSLLGMHIEELDD